MRVIIRFKGGPGSGHYGHSGRPGKRGGSSPGGGYAIPATALNGVDLDANAARMKDALYSRAFMLLEEFKTYNIGGDLLVKVPETADVEDIEYVANLDAIHTFSSEAVRRDGLKPSNATGNMFGSRWYDEELGRLDAVFFSIGRKENSLNYGSNTASMKLSSILNNRNTLVGKDIGMLPAEGNGPGYSAYRRSLLRGSDALHLFAYERTISRFEDEVYGHHIDSPHTTFSANEIMYFGEIPPSELTFSE